MTTGVQPEQVLKDLHKLWIDLAKEDKQKGAAGVLRACAMTLIVAVEEQCDVESAGETIANLIHQHPSRAIVMRVVTNAQESFDARVLAQCWMPFGKRQQICCEQIEITASHSRLEDLPNFILGLMAPDLPVVLWCRSEALARNGSFAQLFPLTDKLILDSASFADPAAAVQFLRDLIAAGRNPADLAWTRLTPLRESVAQMFETGQARQHLKSLNKITIDYAGKASTELTYLIAWFRNTLSLEARTAQVREQPDFTIQAIHFEAPGFTSTLESENRGRSDCELLREELSIIAVDPVFRRCLA